MSAKTYLTVLTSTVLLLLTQLWLPNAWVDPLWFFDGYKGVGPSFAFSTREAKLNRLRTTRERDYDCLVAGSSRALTLDVTAFSGFRCFNLAVEAATLPESLVLFERAAAIVPSPRLVIQTVANFDLERERCEAGLARAAKLHDERAPGWLERYASIDILRFSRKLALGHVRGLGYDDDWRPVLDPFPPHAPRWVALRTALEGGAANGPPAGTYTDACVARLDHLAVLFPDARLIGYVSPISADLVLRMYLERKLAGYLDGVHGAVQHFDAFYDFGAPNELSFDTTVTWDGSHYHPSISQRIADTLLDDEGERDDALRVDTLSLETYHGVYADRLRGVIARLDELQTPGAAP